ncbi:MAG: TatD family hydrolase [Gammaproteobacteria bacterium]|nr:TatD family hydrolase [Gammaproteobacteria bacterium]
MLIDSHCHIDIDAFDHDRDRVISNAIALGVEKMIVPAIDAKSWDKLLKICAQNTSLYPALGLHPIFHANHQPSDLQRLEQYVAKYHPIAIGEIGLDYFIDDVEETCQLYYLQHQLKIAQKYDLPVILHVRKAHDQMLNTLQRIRVKGGVCHAFNGSLQQAKKYIDLGFKLGFGGMLTYARSTRLRKLAGELPLNAIVLETDAPDMTVFSHHGERNSPEFLPDCLFALATLRNLPPDHIAAVTAQNTRDIFELNF